MFLCCGCRDGLVDLDRGGLQHPAYWFTACPSFANSAVTLARAL
jgi:hypothetical protein